MEMKKGQQNGKRRRKGESKEKKKMGGSGERRNRVLFQADVFWDGLREAGFYPACQGG